MWKAAAIQGKKWLSDLLADEKKRVNLLLCMGVMGLLLLAVSEWIPKKEQAVCLLYTSDAADE